MRVSFTLECWYHSCQFFTLVLWNCIWQCKLLCVLMCWIGYQLLKMKNGMIKEILNAIFYISVI